MADELHKFYKGRSKKPALFTYDDDGNLVEKNKEGTVIKTIPLPEYRRPTFEEYDEMEKKRMDAIAVANKEYEDARKELREITTNPNATDSEILRLNRKAIEADIKLQAIRFPIRYVASEASEIRDLDFTQSQEQRKYPYFINILKERPFTLQDQYVRIGKEAEKPLISVVEARAAEDSAISVILFAEPETNDYGYLSLKWVVQLEFNGTQYNSAHQALSAEIAKSFNDQENLQKIMLAETPDEVNYTLDDVPGDADTNETKWNDLTKKLIYDVNILKFSQYPELSARLLETKNAMLGAYLPNDNLIGIGISLDNIQSRNPVNWTGQNLLGKALMDIRDKIRSEKEVAIQPPPVVGALPRPIRRRPKPAPQAIQETSTPETKSVTIIPSPEAPVTTERTDTTVELADATA